MDAYLAKVISALNTFKMCFWAKKHGGKSDFALLFRRDMDMRIWIGSDTFQWDKNSSSIVWINIATLAGNWQHKYSARGMWKELKCVQFEFQSRACNYKISKEILRPHNT